MNPRIKELLEQTRTKGYWSEGRYLVDFVDQEQFAELIVNECASTIQEFVDQRIPASEYPSRLKNHFEA